ncbi:MAG: acyl--CoA ligase [Clostridia bacterium]|nr:acyl--CoA ligase [Clostridia bacterium]
MSNSIRKASIEKPWLQFYPEPMRNFIPSEDTLADFIIKNNESMDKNILEYYGKTFTLDNILTETNKVAKALKAIGVKENDKIVVILRAVPEFIFTLLAAEKIGAAIVCHDGEPMEKAFAINDADAKVAICFDYVSAEEEKIFFDNSKLEKLVLVSPYTYAVKSEIPDYVENAIQAFYTEKSACDERSIKWADFIANGSAIKNDVSVAKNPDRPLYCSYTSGSTGPSKQVLHTARTMNGVLAQLVIPGGIGFTLKVLHTLLPPALVAIVNSILMYNIAQGNYLILDPFCEPEDIDLEFMRYRPNQMIAIPMMADILMNSPRIPEDYPMNDLFVIGGGAEPVHNKWLRNIQAFLKKHGSPAVFSMCYGLSEAGSTVANPRPNQDFLNCGGGIPMRGTTISVFEPGTQNEVEYGVIGEICTSGPSSMIGYGTEADTEKTLQRHADGKIWVHTGDYGYMNELGELFVYSRGLNKRHGGGYLFTTVMENKVIDTDGIKDCFFVIANDTEHEGCFVPYLFVVPEKGIKLADIEDAIKASLEQHEQPVRIIEIEKREYFHFKTNRRILAAKIANGEI